MDDEGFDDVEVIYLDAEHDVEEMIEDDDGILDEIPAQDEPDCSRLTFNKHSKSVFCTDLSRDGTLAVTGGEDDCAYLWSTENGNLLFECTGHKDSVTAVSFNYDGQLLATGDMSGLIQVWDIKNKKIVWYNEGDDMEWLLWHHMTNVLISGSRSGDISIWHVLQGNVKLLASHGSPSTCGKLLSDGKLLIAGYEDGKIKLWDIKSATTKWQFVDSDKLNVTSLELNSDSSLCSIAPSSTLLKVSDGKPLGILRSKDAEDIEVHVFSQDMNFLITGSLKGQICVWDIKMQNIRYEAKLDCGATILKLGLNEKVFFGCTDGTIYMCDIKTGGVSRVLTGHLANILSMTVSQNKNYLLSSSDDTTAKLFYLEY